MNQAMTPDELLKAENAFIRLHNQGVSVEEAAERLGLELSLIKGWREKLETAIQSYDRPDNLDATVQGVNNKGEYIYQQSIQLQLTGLEKLKFDLWRLSNVKSSDAYAVDLIEKAKEYISFAEKYMIKFSYKFKDSNEEGINFTYQLNEDNDTLRNKISELINFYADNILSREYIHSQSQLIKEDAKDYFSDYNDILPYSIKTVVIKNFREIHAARLYHLPIDTAWIFILGDNGYGKSTFLKSLVIGLFGNADDERTLVDDIQTKISIEYKKGTGNSINNLWSMAFRPFEHLACYGPSRLQIQSKMSQNEIAEKSSTTYSLFNPDGILLNIESKLIEWHLEKNERLEQVKTLFRDVIPHLVDIIVQKNDQDDYEILYSERDENNETNTFDPVPFNQLAAGFRSIIGLIGDLLIRFIRKQPHVKQLSELAGIVLIDELENHLHPKWQYQFPTLLSKAFPNIQFIAATHSVIPILGAPKNSVFLKLNRSKEKGITVERIDIDVANLLPNSILTSPIFDMDTIRPIANEDVGQLRTEDTYSEVIANDEIDKQLRELDNDPSQYPALLQE